jgi:nitronate monooxygenase
MTSNPKIQAVNWPDRRLLDLLRIELPIIQAPMASAVTSEMVVAVAEAGGLGSLPCAILSPDQIRTEVRAIRSRTTKPINLNFFCHKQAETDHAREARWLRSLSPYYLSSGLAPPQAVPPLDIPPFGHMHCELLEEVRPEIVSFHFGLPATDLVSRVKTTGAKILSSATSVEEAVWLEDHGCDAIIAQGLDAGGHRGMFLSDDVAAQVGTMTLVPQVADAVTVPVVAAGGIADGRGIVASFALGAAGAQVGTAYLICREARIAPVYRRALKSARDDRTVISNLFSGRPARVIVNRIIRELGPMSDDAPRFPLAGAALMPLRAKAEEAGSDDFTPLWSGQAARLSRELAAGDLTRLLAEEALVLMKSRCALAPIAAG